MVRFLKLFYYGSIAGVILQYVMGINMDNQRLFDFGGGYTGMIGKIFDLLLLGILWILCCLPVITIGASTTALYYSVVKSVKKGKGYAFREFFHAFRVNFVPATGIWAAVAGVTFVVQLNMGILMQKTSGYTGLFFICFYFLVSVFVFALSCYVFPALSRFDMSAGWIVKLGMYMAVRYLLTTLAVFLVIGCVLALFWALPMSIFFTPGAAVFIISDFMERVLEKHMPDEVERSPVRKQY